MNRLLICTSLLFSLFVASVAPADEVKIPDENLRKLIRKILAVKQIKEEKITDEHMSKIFFLHGNGLGIKDLTGLEHCWNLAEVRLAKNKINNVGPLEKCVNIQSLDLAENEISDVGPLGKLVKLQYVNLEKNKVKNIRSFEQLHALSSLYMDHNEVLCLAPLAKLPRLSSLHLSHNRLRDLQPVAGMKRLTSLGAANNDIKDVKPLQGLKLSWTFLQGNKIKNIEPLVDMAKSDKRRDFAPYWKLYLADNPIQDESKEDLFAQLKEVGVRLNTEDKRK